MCFRQIPELHEIPPRGKVHAPFNKKYDKEDLGSILSWVDTDRALSAVGYHKGLMVAPISFDFGGGIGDGAFVAYNIDDPRNPIPVFDSRDYPDLYHDEEGEHYLGDLGEHHGLYFYKDMMLMSDRGKNHNGILILDIGPLYDDDPETLPEVVSRYHFPDVEKSTVYDGFTFAPAWVGGKYIYAPTGSTGLYIISTENIKEPKLITHMTKAQLYNQTLRSVHALGDLLVLSPAAIASVDGDMVLLDVSDPQRPNLINRHTIKIGYQGILYGNRFYNGGWSGNRGTDSISEITAYDFSNPLDIKEIELAKTNRLLKTEYMYLQDDDMYIGHYPGLSKWKVTDDKATFDVAVEPQHPPNNDYAFVSPLGNLVIITSDHEVKSKLNIGVHQLEPDLKPPTVKSVFPKNNAKNVSVLTKIGISFSDFLDNECLENEAIYLQEKGSTTIIPCGFSHGLGIAHVIPKKPLEKNMTYEVYVTENLMDLVGNPFEKTTLVTQFSTGNQLADYKCRLITDAPKKVGEKVEFKAVINDRKKAKSVLYSWNFGDGFPETKFSSKPIIEKIFSNAGNYNITLTTKQKGTERLLKSTAVQVVHNPAPESRPVSSSTIHLDEKSNRFYVVNPDNNTLTAFSIENGNTIYETQTGKNPLSVAAVGKQLWVTCKKDDEVQIFDSQSGNLVKKIKLDYGSAPHGIVFNNEKKVCYIAYSRLGQLQEIDIQTYNLGSVLQLDGPLMQLAYIPNSQKLVAPQFIASEQLGAITNWVDTEKWKIISKERLVPTMLKDGLSNGRGYPNYLGSIAVNPEQTNLWIPGKKDNLFRGLKRDGKPLLFDHTVRSIAVNMDIETNLEVENNRIDLDNSDMATAATFNAYGNIAYVATLGSQTISAIDAYNTDNQSVFNTYGEGTTAMVTNSSGTRLYAHNQLSRNIAVFETKASGELNFLTKWNTVGSEMLTADVLDGKRIFHNTVTSNLSREGYMSCASCHFDGGHDGRVWDLSNLGEGLRNTIDLNGKEGMKHGTLHWTANFDEIQDFDDQIRNLNEGTGFLFDALKKAHQPLFESKSGLHTGLDNLAKYVTSLGDYPKSPYKNENGEMTNSAQNGRNHFVSLKCYTCHAGPTFTDSGFGNIHNVGTLNDNSGNKLGEELTGLDTPSLISIWQNAPYLHDGSAKTLKDVFTAGKGKDADAHKITNTLSEKELDDLVSFLKQLDSEDGITNTELGIENTKPIFETKSQTFDYAYDYTIQKHSIGKVSATDLDAGQKLRYKIVPSVYSTLFKVDSLSGDISYNFKEIYLKNISNKVLTTKRTFDFGIVAVDDGAFALRDTTNIIVNVTFPNIPLENKELNEFIKLRKSLDSEQELTAKETERMETLSKKITPWK